MTILNFLYYFSVYGDCGEDCAGVWRPRHVAHLRVQVEHEQGLAAKSHIKIQSQISSLFNAFFFHFAVWSQILIIHSAAHVRNTDGT